MIVIILNFAHPLTPQQIDQVATLAGQRPQAVRDVKVHFAVDQPFVEQVRVIVDDLDISSSEWQSQPWLIVLPSLNYIAGILLAELHGRLGHFPAVLRLRAVPNALVTEYEVAEIINLEAVRQRARSNR